MSIKISALPSATSVGDNDLVPIVQGGETKKALASAFGGGGGGTSDYTNLSNKPSINSVTLTGNKTSGDLNLVGTGDIATTIDSASTNSQVAGAKAVYDATLDNYSTTEQMIGTWIDGKPLYRKIVTNAFPQVTSDGTQAYTSIDLSSLSPEEVIIEWANTFNAAKTSTQMFPIARNVGTTSNSELIARVLYSSNYLYIYCKIQSYNTNTLIASILYTKTTDTATTNSLNTAQLMNTGSLVGMGDRAEVTVEEKAVEVEPIETLKEEKESGDTI